MVVLRASSAVAVLVLAMVAASPARHASNPIEEQWRSFEQGLRETLNTLSKQYSSTALRQFYKLNVSAECTTSLLRLYRGILKLQRWALSYLDFTGKLPDGIIAGRYTSLGSHDACLSLETEVRGKVLFRGQYCSMRAHPPLPPEPTDFRPYRFLEPIRTLDELSNYSRCERGENVICEGARFALGAYFEQPIFGVCLPDTCSADDLNKMANGLLDALGLGAIKFKVSSCKTATMKPPMTLGQKLVIALFGSILSVLLVSTLIELTLPLLPSALATSDKMVKFVRCFSLYTNTKDLMRTDNLAHPRLRFIHGLRFFSFCWVALGHMYVLLPALIPIVNGLKGLEVLRFPLLQIIHNGILSVDTFLFLSGFLLTYLNKDKMDLLWYPKIFLKAFLKLSIPTSALLLFTLIMPLMISNPNEDRVNILINGCPKDWWRHTLLILNLFPLSMKQTCLFQTWFVAVQVQLFVLGLMLLVVLHRNTRRGILLLLVSIIIFMSVSFYLTFHLNFNPAPPIGEYSLLWWFQIFVNPALHVVPFIAGMILGHLIAKEKITHLSGKQQLVGWLLGTAAGFFSVFWPFVWLKPLVSQDLLFASKLVYAALNRLCWSLSVGWITLACYLGVGGFIQEFLSWEAFLPFSRLSFGAFYMHASAFHLLAGNITVELEMSHTILISLLFAILALNFGYAYVFQMVVVYPMEKLLRLRTPPIKKDPKEEELKEEYKNSYPIAQIQLKSCNYISSN